MKTYGLIMKFTNYRQSGALVLAFVLRTTLISAALILFSAQAFAVTPAPTASLQNGFGIGSVTVAAGDQINYTWNSTNAISASSTYTTDVPICGVATTGPFSWSAIRFG